MSILTALLVLLAFNPMRSRAAQPAAPDSPNVLLIIIDALRPDHLGCYGYTRPTSPVIDGLAEEAVVFETAVAQAPWTKGSLSSMFTSLYPFQHGATTWSAVLPDSFVTLAELLRARGYSTLCAVNMIGMAGRFGVLQGFDKVSSGEKYERNAVETTDDTVDLLKDSCLPFFMVVHYYDVHGPYRPPLKYVDKVASRSELDSYMSRRAGGEVSPEDIQRRMLLSYDGCIRYVDDSVGRLLGILDDMGVGDETLIIVTADHGEALGEHGVYGHGAEAYDDAIKVPLLIKLPDGSARPGRVDAQVRHIDLMPTILKVCGIDDQRHREGLSLLPLIEMGKRGSRREGFFPVDMAMTDCTNRGVPGKMALRTQRWKLIVDPVTSLFEFYDLRDDPEELRNIWGMGSPIEDELSRNLRRVPGARTPGWRVAFVGGQEQHTFTARVRLAGGCIRHVGQSARVHRNLEIEVSDDSVSMDIRSSVGGPHYVLFDTDLEGVEVTLSVSNKTAGGPDSISVGKAAMQPVDTEIKLSRQEAHGIADGFATHRPEDGPGVFVWYLPGVRVDRQERATLSPEEAKRLKALGYIQ